jgi:hypothetical protein
MYPRAVATSHPRAEVGYAKHYGPGAEYGYPLCATAQNFEMYYGQQHGILLRQCPMVSGEQSYSYFVTFLNCKKLCSVT